MTSHPSLPAVPALAAPAPIILAVDDEHTIRSALRRDLRRFGYEVLTAESGEAALELLSGRCADLPQVVISDQRLQHMDGVTFLTRVKERWPVVQRVLITGFADMENIERAVNEAGIYRFLNKPWEDLSLLGTVRSAVEQWQALDENQRLMAALAGHNRRLEEAVAARTAELTHAQRLWEQTFDAIADPLMVLDEGYHIQRANRALHAQLGMAEGDAAAGQVCHELRARSAWRLPRTPEGPCLGCPVAVMRAQGMSAPAEGELQGESGRLTLKSFPLERLAVCAYRDVTRERETAQQLALTDRLAAIGQLAGGVAHELNNPLSGVLAFSQLLLRDVTGALTGAGGPDLGEQREFLAEIESAAQRCKRIVENLQRFSRQARRDEVGPVDLNRLVVEALTLVEHQWTVRGVQTVRHLAEDLPEVLASGAQMQQVLMNLLANAYDATLEARERGMKDLDAQPAPRFIEIVTSHTAETVVLSVRDQGPGIAERHVAQLFLPFFTTKPEGRGTGLGLAVSYGIVRDHGGTIRAHNLPDKGAEFVVTMPACLPARAGIGPQ